MQLEQDLIGRQELSAYSLLAQCQDEAMRKVVEEVDLFKDQRRVLITGETGTGKELVAAALVERNSVGQRKFVTLDCANLNSHIMGSELFGHEKGSFTGAHLQHIGLFEAADGGTAFLDEIGEIPLDLQPRLLRVIQGQPFCRVGGLMQITPKFRLIAATNRDLPSMVRKGMFREDLYYRIRAFGITVPPLRERRTDLIRLANHFVAKFSEGKKLLAEEARQAILTHSWAGNVRDLENVIERAVVVARDVELIRVEHLGFEVSNESVFDQSNKLSLEELVDLVIDKLRQDHGSRDPRELRLLKKIESLVIKSVTKKHDGIVIRASRDLGLDRITLRKRIHELFVNTNSAKS